MRRLIYFLLIGLLITTSGYSRDKSADWSIDSLSVDSLNWGPQDYPLHIQNLSDEYKFLTLRAFAMSLTEGVLFPSNRLTHHIIFPQSDTTITFTIDVPRNLAPIRLQVWGYDVVDTLDDLSLATELFQITQRVPIHYPEGLRPLLDSIPVPTGATRYNKNFDSDVRRIIYGLYTEGMTQDKIAPIVGMEAGDVVGLVSPMYREGMIRVEDGKIVATLPVIKDLPFEDIDTLVTHTAERFAKTIGRTMPEYRELLTEQIDSGVVTPDSNESSSGSVIAHHPYLLIGGITLCEYMSATFVAQDSLPPMFHDLAAPCTRNNPNYDYLLASKEVQQGGCTYFCDTARGQRSFGIHVPALDCENKPFDNYGKSYSFPVSPKPIVYSYSPGHCRKIVFLFLDALRPDYDTFAKQITTLYANAGKELDGRNRWWLWNRVVTETMDTLVRLNVLKDKSQQYYGWSGALR